MNDISVSELKQRLQNGEKLVIIDVREPWEYDEFNIGAINIPLGNLPQSLEDLAEHQSEEIIVHCRSGKRSGVAKELMQQAGFTQVRNLLGGMLEWQATT